MSKTRIVLKKIIGGFFLEKANFREKMRLLKLSHSAEDVKWGNLGAFLTTFNLFQIVKKN